MRIGIDVRALMEGKTTGVETYVINLLHALFKLDQKNQYVLFANALGHIDARIRIFQYPNIEYRIFHYPNKIFNILQNFFAWPKVDRMLGRVDLFFSPHWRVLPLSRGTPLVVTFHDLSFEIYPEFFTLWKRMWHKFMGYKRAAKADILIAVSENTKRDLKGLYKVPEEKIRVVYSGVSARDKPRELIPGLPEKFFLALGTFEPRKNLDAVTAAYQEYLKKSIQKLPLVIAGNKGWKIKLEFAAALRDKIFILQNISEDEKTHLYEHAAALLFLSFYEGFGFPVLEAASFGIPVIASTAPSLAEIAGNFALFVNPFRASQACNAMIDIEQSESLRQSLSQRGLRAVKNFTWERTAEQVLEIFNSLEK